MQVSVACPVRAGPCAAVAVIVTGFATAAVHVAVTCVVGVLEKCTEGSLAVQFEFANAGVIATLEHPGLLLGKNDALNISLFAGATAVWSTVTEAGVTFKATGSQLGELEPPHPRRENNATDKRT